MEGLFGVLGGKRLTGLGEGFETEFIVVFVSSEYAIYPPSIMKIANKPNNMIFFFDRVRPSGICFLFTFPYTVN